MLKSHMMQVIDILVHVYDCKVHVSSQSMLEVLVFFFFTFY